MLTEEMLEESSYYQMILEKGIEKGIERGIERGIEKGIEKGIERGIDKGIAAGRIEEGRRMLRRLLVLRFPGLESLPEIDTITDPERIEGLLEAVVTAPDAETARAAVRRTV